jgi:hypothetical protein
MEVSMTLNQLLNSLGIARAARYTLEEVAHILGMTTRQVRTQIQKGHLSAAKISARRWAWVLHTDLDAYFAAINGGVR